MGRGNSMVQAVDWPRVFSWWAVLRVGDIFVFARVSCLLLTHAPGMLLCNAQAVQEFSWPVQASNNSGFFGGAP